MTTDIPPESAVIRIEIDKPIVGGTRAYASHDDFVKALIAAARKN